MARTKTRTQRKTRTRTQKKTRTRTQRKTRTRTQRKTRTRTRGAPSRKNSREYNRAISSVPGTFPGRDI